MKIYRFRAMVLGFSLAFAFLMLSACVPVIAGGSGRSESQVLEVSNFDRVALSAVGNMNIEQGDVESLTITADDNILPLISTQVQNGVLEIDLDRPMLVVMNATIRYDLKVKNLRGLEISGSGEVAMDRLRTDVLRLNISGSGTVAIADATANEIGTNISGSGRVQLAGATNTQTVRVSGSGKYAAEDLASRAADVEVSGSGAVIVWATDSLDVSISGSGNVYYYGRPAVDHSVSGSGQISSNGEK